MLAFNIYANHRSVQMCTCHSDIITIYVTSHLHFTYKSRLSCWEVEGMVLALQLGEMAAKFANPLDIFEKISVSVC